jgi:hypothetical protein
MAQREASIRVTMRRGSFNQQLRGMTSQVSTAGKRMGSALSGPMSAGLSAARKSMGGLFRSLKSSVGMALRLGGALSAGIMIKGAVDLQSRYRNIAFNISKIPGEMMSWKQVQSVVEDAAAKTGQRTEDMADAFDKVFAATGDLQFTKDVLESIGVSATNSGKSASQFADVASLLRRKWGAAGDEIGDMMAKFVEKTEVGGLSVDNLTGKFDLMAGEAAAAGLNTAEGMSQLLGVIKQLDARMEAGKLTSAMNTFLQYAKDGTTQMERLQKEGQIKFEPDMTPFEKIEKMLVSPKAMKILPKVFTGTSLAIVEELSKPYLKAVKEAREAGVSMTEAREVGIEAFRDNLKEISKSTWTAQTALDELGKRMDDPAVQMRKAMDRIQQAFTQPEMLEAIESLAKQLPWLAKKMAELIGWIAKNPWKALGAAGGLKVGGAFAGGMLPGLGRSFLDWSRSVSISGATITRSAVTAGATTTTAATTAGASLKAGAATVGAGIVSVLGAGAVGAAIGGAIHDYFTGPQSEKKATEIEAAEANLRAAEKIIADPTATVEQRIEASKKIAKTPDFISMEQFMGQITSPFVEGESPLERKERLEKGTEAAQRELTNQVAAHKIAQQKQNKEIDIASGHIKRFGQVVEEWIPKGKPEIPTGGPRGTNRLLNTPGSENPEGPK